MEDPAVVASILIRKGHMTAAATRFSAWRMLAIAFLAQNCVIGIAIGSYGTLITSLQAEFNTSRSLASSGVSVMLLVLGLMSPFMGMLLARFSIRTIMVTGAVLFMVGYLLLAQANSIYMVLAIYAALFGPGYCMLGIIAPATLVSRWFVRHRGKALGVMSMPLFLAIVPPIAAFLTIRYSLQSVYLLFAGIFALLLPLLLTIVDHPPAAAAEADTAAVPAGGAQTGLMLGNIEILAKRDFWLVNIGMGVITGAGIAFATHLVPMALEKSIPLQAASTLMTGYGVAGIAGALLLGWLCDRLGPVTVFVVDCVTLMLLWFLLLNASNFVHLMGVAAMIGLCLTSVVGVHAAALSLLFGPQNLPKAMGFAYFIKIPFLFGAAPLVGYIYDRSGSYAPAILLCLAAFGVAALLFLVVRQSARRQPRPLLA